MVLKLTGVCLNVAIDGFHIPILAPKDNHTITTGKVGIL